MRMDLPQRRLALFSIYRFNRIFGSFWIVILVASFALLQPDGARAQAAYQPVDGPSRQEGEVVQFRGLKSFPDDPNLAPQEQTDNQIYQLLVLTFKDNAFSGSASLDTDITIGSKVYTIKASFNLSGTYDLGTGVIQGTFDQFYSARYDPDPGYPFYGDDIHYYGNFDNMHLLKTFTPFSINDKMVGLSFYGSSSRLTYAKGDPVWDHGIEQVAFLVNFAREEPAGVDETPAAGETLAGTGCTPNIRGLDPQKPGDVISPGADYLDPDGSQVGIIQERWFINGQETNSAVWDGLETKVELQWTCLDHKGYSQSFVIPAYQAASEPQSAAPPSPSSSGGLLPGAGAVLAVLGGLTGVGGLLGFGGSILRILTTAGTPVPKPVPTVTPPARPPAPPAQPQVQTPAKADPSLKKPWEQKVNELIDQRTRIQEKILSTNQSIDKLTRVYKKNLLKVILKGGMETGQILTDALTGGTGEIPNIATEIGKKTLMDKITDSVFQKHDTSQDGKNVVGLKNLIDTLKNQRDQLRSQVRDLNLQIKGVQERISQVP